MCAEESHDAGERTSVNDRVGVTVLEGAADLTGKLARRAFSQPAVRDDVVEHLPSVDVLKDHIVVVLLEGGGESAPVVRKTMRPRRRLTGYSIMLRMPQT